jgi:hypothetical protein
MANEGDEIALAAGVDTQNAEAVQDANPDLSDWPLSGSSLIAKQTETRERPK